MNDIFAKKFSFYKSLAKVLVEKPILMQDDDL
jgi:hypothetical protein